MFSPYSQADFRLRDPSSAGNAEPMTIGSPVSSPQNKSMSNQNFLPSYLFGEPSSPQIMSPSWSSPISATKRPRTSYQSPSNIINPISQFKEQQIYQSPSSSVISSPNPSKSGAPPVQGLLYSTPTVTSSFNASKLDDVPCIGESQVSFSADASHYSGILTPSRSFSVNNTTYMSPAQLDPFYTQGEALKSGDQLDESWVTVFGFPSASSSYILQQFNQYGNIVEHKLPPNGNWMHIKYQSKLQAKKALSKNGKVFSGNIMVGVKPCIEMDLMESYKENKTDDTSLVTGQESSQSELAEHNKPNLKNIRPLTQAYQSSNPQIQVTTQKPGGIVSKALEYLWKS